MTDHIEVKPQGKIIKGMSDALGFAKGADVGARITIYSATEFFFQGIRFNPGSYEIKKIPDAERHADEDQPF